MDIELFRGDTWERVWQFNQPLGDPVDLTGATVRVTARDSVGTVKITATVANGAMVVSGSAGLITMKVPAANTKITPGYYTWDLEVTYSNGTVRTYESGSLTIVEDVSFDV